MEQVRYTAAIENELAQEAYRKLIRYNQLESILLRQKKVYLFVIGLLQKRLW